MYFTLRVRNHPHLMQYFRQDDPISIEAQRQFIQKDVEHGGYNGRVICIDNEPVGLCGVKSTGEFTIGVLPEYQKQGISTWVMKELIRTHPGLWSDVFLGNPALEWFIKLGFKVVGVRERAYYKQDLGLIDAITIKHV